MSNLPPSGNRRDFLSGKSIRRAAEHAGEKLADRILADAPETSEIPAAGPTIRLGKRAMACEFDVILNPGPATLLDGASAALDLVDRLEDQMSVYRPESELSRINRSAHVAPVTVEQELFELLVRASEIAAETEGAFEPTAGPLVALWRRCRNDPRLPTESEIASALELVGTRHVSFDESARTIRYDRAGVEFNLGAIGKGYALDRAGDILTESGIESWLIHGGLSSILARGDHAGHAGWPIGIRNPLFPDQTFVTLLLKDCGMSTSGSGVQYFRLGGKRYGHILDPRSGWPVEGMLSVTVLAPTAAEADALSTAFFVLGVEKAQEYCHNHPEVRALLIPQPASGRRLAPVNCGIPDQLLFFAPDERPA